MTYEKAADTLHVSISRNCMFGGESPTPQHLDCVVGGPTLHVDSERLDLPDTE